MHVFAVVNQKGGVGKTNIAANFAYIFSKMGEKVLLLDADTGLANIDVILGVTPKYSLLHVLHGEKDLSEVIVQGPGGIKILPAASGIQEMAELSRGQKLTLLEELDNLNEDLDFMFIDTAAGIAGNVMYFNMVAKEIIVVVSPEPTSLTDAYALIKLLHQRYATRRFMLLVNMVRGSKEAKEVYRRLSNATDHFLNLSIDYLGYILCDKSVHEAVKRQNVLVDLFPYSKASRCLFTVAEKLSRERAEDYEPGTIKFFGRIDVDRNK
jgi:flagellar biosynthesis protein FlhG